MQHLIALAAAALGLVFVIGGSRVTAQHAAIDALLRAAVERRGGHRVRQPLPADDGRRRLPHRVDDQARDVLTFINEGRDKWGLGFLIDGAADRGSTRLDRSAGAASTTRSSGSIPRARSRA